jgi:hypothetical protein
LRQRVPWHEARARTEQASLDRIKIWRGEQDDTEDVIELEDSFREVITILSSDEDESDESDEDGLEVQADNDNDIDRPQAVHRLITTEQLSNSLEYDPRYEYEVEPRISVRRLRHRDPGEYQIMPHNPSLMPIAIGGRDDRYQYAHADIPDRSTRAPKLLFPISPRSHEPSAYHAGQIRRQELDAALLVSFPYINSVHSQNPVH